MPPRTPLGIINNNRRQNNELTPHQRGKIEGAQNAGFTFTFAAEQVKCHLETAKMTLLFASERLNGYIKKRIGRLNT